MIKLTDYKFAPPLSVYSAKCIVIVSPAVDGEDVSCLISRRRGNALNCFNRSAL